MKVEKGQLGQMFTTLNSAMGLEKLPDSTIKAIIINKNRVGKLANDFNDSIMPDMTDEDIKAVDQALGTAWNKFRKDNKARFDDKNEPKRNDGVPYVLGSEWDKTHEMIMKANPKGEEKINAHREKIDNMKKEEIEVDIIEIFELDGLTPAAVEALSFMVHGFEEWV